MVASVGGAVISAFCVAVMAGFFIRERRNAELVKEHYAPEHGRDLCRIARESNVASQRAAAAAAKAAAPKSDKGDAGL